MAEVTVKSLGRSAAYGVVAQVWRIGSRFVLTPLILSRIGLDGYGVWTLLFTLCAYVNLVDATFSIAYSKFTAEYDAKGDYRTLAQIIGSGMAFVGGIGAVVLTLLWLWHAPILNGLGVPAEMVPQAGQALLIVSACVLMRMCAGCVFQVLAGLQRLDLRYKLGILASAIEFGVSIVLLYAGHGLLALALGHLAGQVVATAAAWRLCRRLCPQLRISPFNVSRRGLRSIISLGGRFQALAVLQLLMAQGIKVLISGLLGVSTLAIYEIAQKLLSLGSAVAGAVIAPLMPAFANLHAGEDRSRLTALYERGSRLVAATCMPCYAFLAIFADRLILLWTGQDYPLAAWTVRCLAVPFVLLQLTGVGTSSLRGRGVVRLELLFGIINATIIAALVGPGYWLWGYKGILASVATSVLVGSSWFLIAFARQEWVDLKGHAKIVLLRPILVLGPVIAATALLQPVLALQLSFSSTRVCTLIDLSVWGFLFCLVVSASAWYGLLSQKQRSFIMHYFRSNRRGSFLEGLVGPGQDAAATESR